MQATATRVSQSDHRPCLIDTEFEFAPKWSKQKGKKQFTYINTKMSVEATLKWLHQKHLRNPEETITLEMLWEALQNNLITSTSWTPVSSFWNAELSKLKRLRNAAYPRREDSPESLERYRTLDNRFKHAYRKAKHQFQRSEVEELCRSDPTGSKAWSICKTLEPDMRTRRKPTWQTQTIPPEEHVNIIAEQFRVISDDPELNSSQEENETYNQQIAEARSAPNTAPISTQEIKRAIAQSRSKGAAGADRITPKLLKLACEQPMFLNAFKAGLNNAYQTGMFPDVWKNAKVVPLPKPNKQDEFRPISLLNTMSKIFEKIMEQRIRESIEDKLSPIQHGCRSGHSTTQALCRFAHNSSLARAHNEIFGAIAFDFSKAYDRVPKTRLINKLVALNVPGPLIVLVDNWLTNRSLTVYYRGEISNPMQIPHGIPQGSALSVLLWLIYINDLGNVLDQQHSNIYVDDTIIWAAGTTKTVVRNILQAETERLAEWAAENKVKLNWEKLQLIFSTHHRRDPSIHVQGHQIKPKTTMKYLGVNFESNNDFKTLTYDLKSIGADIRRRAAVVQRLNKYNFPRKVIRQFTEGFVHAKLRYISPLLGAETTKTLDPIEKGLRAALRTELGAVKTTPIPLLYKGSQSPMLKELIARDSARLILRSIAQKTILGQEYLDWDGTGDGWSPLGAAQETLSDLHLQYILPIRTIPIRVRDAMQKCRYHVDYTKEDAMNLHTNNLLIHPADISLWCDASFINETSTIGAAALWFDSDNALVATEQETRGNASSSYEGELHALRMGLRMIRDRGPSRQTIRIYTDSKSVITHLRAVGLRYRPEDDTIKECAHLLARLVETNQVAIHWIPGHHGIENNEAADCLAKQALLLPPVAAPESESIRFSTYNLQITKRMQSLSSLQINDKISESRFRNYPPRSPFLTMTAKDVVLGPLFRLRTGHTYCLAHLKNTEIVDEDNCRLCLSNTRETVEHQLLECPQLASTLQEFRSWISRIQHIGGLRYAMWKQPRRLEKELVKALQAGAHF
jgi:ribonuclease HI